MPRQLIRGLRCHTRPLRTARAGSRRVGFHMETAHICKGDHCRHHTLRTRGRNVPGETLDTSYTRHPELGRGGEGSDQPIWSWIHRTESHTASHTVSKVPLSNPSFSQIHTHRSELPRSLRVQGPIGASTPAFHFPVLFSETPRCLSYDTSQPRSSGTNHPKNSGTNHPKNSIGASMHLTVNSSFR